MIVHVCVMYVDNGKVRSKSVIEELPFTLSSYYAEDATTMDLDGFVSYSYNHLNVWRVFDSNDFKG